MKPRPFASSVLGRLGAALVTLSLPSVALALSAADYFVHSLPGAPAEPPIKMHAGHIEITPESNGNLFFWHFQNQHIANKQRTVVWLNGGPGCSSEDGALMEIGPYRVNSDMSLSYNDGSWSEFANLLFVDNPVGTGFSYVSTNSYVTELTQMAEQFVTFLEKYFAIFPEYEHDDLYFAGESYAGQHIPYIAKAILDRNKKATTKTKWALKGLLIGNGWISPKEQYEAYLDFSYARGIIDKNSENAQKLQQQWRICETTMATDPGRVDYSQCEAILRHILEYTADINSKGQRQCYNMYDIRLKDLYSACGMNWPPDLRAVEPYLRNKDVVSALHVNSQKVSGWAECSNNVGQAFRNHDSPAAVKLLPEILTEVPILLFSGADDLICNHMGTEAFIGNLEWNGGKGFEVTPGNWAPRRDWTFEGEIAGFWQEARNLTYVLFYNASHMVPFDQSRRSRDMLDRFMGVDISSIGGKPTDSRLDGEKGPQTSVTDPPKKPEAQAEEQEQAVQDAKWQAYRRSGEIVLVLAVIGFCIWGYYVWRERRNHKGYSGLEPNPGGPIGGAPRGGVRGVASGLEGFRSRRGGDRDVEAGDFDESELDELHLETPTDGKSRYSIGMDSDEEESDEKRGRHEAGSSGSSSR
ncbi:hypothetical protein jhhlp_007630 [Lomentospora prolificans]|uniref:Pheromone-processing carboxypeptidase KEX1 n=1 Tax=Lomentospora prolificans TaxID=41688 RepID=A0A2N3N041_9PEZI|nr:hypothetical protein jhhlp_007630 [Lomentospora prolificans]